jgi:ADP-ribose pyrophosphatase YjhB (NUDIX family)
MTAEGQQEHTDPVPAVDFIIRNDINSKTILLRRKSAPFKDILSIPGRFINREEIVEDPLRRRAKEEAFLVVKPIAIRDVYCEAERESMMRTISITVITKLVQGDEEARDDLAAVQRSNKQEAEESLKVKSTEV